MRYSYANEREMLFKMLFEMRREIDRLRQEVEQGSGSHNTIKDFRRDYGRQHSLPAYSGHHIAGEAIDAEASQVIDELQVSAEVSAKESAMMTLEDTERETIRRSLERNEGKRKKTAEELKISERTLYRKIKEYGLE